MGSTVARVGIVMGSDSDWPIMEAAAQALAEFDIGYEVRVSSAHRMPHATLEYGQTAEARGLQVLIAGAGGAAHLPGVLAAVTPLPVKTSDDPKTMLRADLENENSTIRAYRERLRQCEAMEEYAIAEDIREILRQEQEHQTDLATALGVDVPDVSRKG